MLPVIIIMVIYVVLTRRLLRATGIPPTLVRLFFFSAEWDTKDISSVGWHLKPANQSGALRFMWADWLSHEKASAPAGCISHCAVTQCLLSQQLFYCSWPFSVHTCLCLGTVKSVNSRYHSITSYRNTETVAKYSFCWDTRCTYVKAVSAE